MFKYYYFHTQVIARCQQNIIINYHDNMAIPITPLRILRKRWQIICQL